jgi:sugar phosphate isomerase/epimerase
MLNVIRRAQQVGITRLVFGSGGARNVPDGFDRKKAVSQITAFARMSAELAALHGVTIVIEPLNKGECNIINSVAEGMEYVKAVNNPAFQCLVDSYHFWLEDEPLENLKAAMPWIKHVHLADKVGRVAPGLSGQSDYKPFFKVLKDGGYDGTISFEGTTMPDFAVTAPKVLEFIKQQWS